MGIAICVLRAQSDTLSIERLFLEIDNVLSVDIKSWDIQNLLIVSQTFELSLKIKIVIKELNFNLMFLTICHNFHNLICKKPNLHNVYF
jgi:small-conductance mechanosensitive channel